MWKIIRSVWARRRWCNYTIGIKIINDEQDPYQAPTRLILLKTCVATQCILKKGGQTHSQMQLINGSGICELWLN
jgi:hypothetical protein